ncbi:helix-turn-helix transcriptional regulator [Microbacterium sp. zg.Y909]|uniref:helix-turn-helix transcriptional regulator n=1 Tax=Microbacterium sp. zg.Y909 TaxID=2969413 RepID=UPI00214CB871|nr:LuxR C-terminal-related transcriptional regulator [Microbacterium sp. zg.Y909]MCR2827239.1 LuxR C-terminal-related transcriptional regulator [Microbacterium sp. zg.Y909]
MATPSPSSGLVGTIAESVRAGICVVLVGLPGSGRRDVLRALRGLFEQEEWAVRTVTGHGVSGRPLESLALSGVQGPGGAGGLTTLSAAQALAPSGAVPTLLLVEDGDRLDDTSATALAAAADDPAVTVVIAMRPPYPGSTVVDRLLARQEATALWMPPASFEAIHRLVSDTLGGDVDADAAGRVYALSGGLPGIARAITVTARQAGRLVQRGERWSAERDLWSRALAATLVKLVEGLSDTEREGCWLLAELGPAELATVLRLLPWSTLTSLDDRGLLRFVDDDRGPVVALFPPVLEDHLRHRAPAARGRAAAARIAEARPQTRDAAALPGETVRPPLHAPNRWSSSPEAAAILGRVLGEESARRVTETRAQWRAQRTAVTAVAYVQALVDDGADDHEIDAVLAAASTAQLPADRDALRLRLWEVVYRATSRREPHRAMALLAETTREIPGSGAAVSAVEQHLRLMIPGLGTAELPASPLPAEIEEVRRLSRPMQTTGLPRWHAVDIVRLVRGEVLLSGGRTSDAVADFADLSPADPLRRDPYSVIPLAQLCDGDIAGAVQRSQRQLDLARGTLDRTSVEPHAYVVALGLFLQGRMATLRDHLTSVFAVNAPAVLAPDSRAGLLSISAGLSLWEGAFDSAHDMIVQLDALGLSGGPFPYMSSAASAAALALARGVPAAEATTAAWQEVTTLIDEGYLLAAVFEGVRLLELHVDGERSARTAQVAFASQGSVMPALGAFLEGACAHSPERLLATADTLRDTELVLFGTRAHAMAVRYLRQEGRAEDASRESLRLRRAVHAAGDDLSLVLSARLDPASVLTPREREVAHLIAAGHTNREVAERLVVSERTIDNHLYRVFRKLGVNTREDLVGLV